MTERTTAARDVETAPIDAAPELFGDRPARRDDATERFGRTGRGATGSE